jgi:desulfoferrodoxin (superoxide reductase-like protein)
VVGFKHFVSQGAGAATMAAVEFVVPASVEAVVAFTHCNLHDTWRSEPILRG